MSLNHFAGLVLACLLAPAALALPRPATVGPTKPPATDAAADARLASDLTRTLHGIPALREVKVMAAGGTVTLDGRVTEAEHSGLATGIARQHAGVVRVDNRLQAGSGLVDRLEAALQQAYSKLIGLVAKLPLLAVAALIVMLAAWLGGVLGGRVRFSRFGANNPYIDSLVGRLVRWGVLGLGLLLALDLMGATAVVGALLGSAGVVGIALGFAFRDIAENYVAGILLSLRRWFAPGDHILVDKYEGKVVALTARSTLLMTFDGNQVSVPNGLVFKSVVTNFSQNDNRRFDFTVVIDTSESVRAAQSTAMEAIAGVCGVLADPAPSTVVDGYLGGGIQLRFFGWVNQRQSDLGKVRSEALRAVKAAFEAAHVEGPRPVQYVFSAPLTPQMAERLGMGTEPKPPEPDTAGDTSVNHDIDAQLNAERRARGDENLI